MAMRGSWEELLSRKTVFLSSQEEAELLTLAKAGDRVAEHRIIVTHLKFIHRHAMRFQHPSKTLYWDMFSEAVYGFVKAIQTHDPAKGSLRTRAAWCIRAACSDWISRNSLSVIHVSGRKLLRLSKLTRDLERLKATSTAVPEAMLAEHAKLSADVDPSICTSVPDLDVLSGEMPHIDGDTVSRDAEQSCASIILTRILKRANLPERYLLILNMHFGNDELSFTDIARELGVSKTRPRQILNESLSRLRRTAKLCDYTNVTAEV